MSTNREARVTWTFSVRQSSLFLRQPMDIGKFHFEPAPRFDMDDYQARLKEALSKKSDLQMPKLNIQVSWSIAEGELAQIREDSLGELRAITDLISLQTGMRIERVGFLYDPAPPGGLHLSIPFPTRRLRYQELNAATLEGIMNLKGRIDQLDQERRKLVLLALDWYSRGLNEEDVVNSFALYWIGFESLSLWNGDGPHRRCPHCGQDLEDESINQRLKQFVTFCGVSTPKKVGGLYELRNNLFHRGTHVSQEHRAELAGILKGSILACLDCSTHR